MANSNEKEEFNNLIKQLEYLHYKNNQLKRNDEYYKAYETMDTNALIIIKFIFKKLWKKIMKFWILQIILKDLCAKIKKLIVSFIN